jgi:hypothetical protein
MKTVNETGYDENSGYGDDKFVEKDQDHDEDGEDEDDENGDNINSEFGRFAKGADVRGHAENRTHRKPPSSKEVHDPQKSKLTFYKYHMVLCYVCTYISL